MLLPDVLLDIPLLWRKRCHVGVYNYVTNTTTTVKDILDEIEQDLLHGETSNAHGSVVKRTLAFGGDLSESFLQALTSQSDLPEEIVHAPTLLPESPAKKVKSREKEKQN